MERKKQLNVNFRYQPEVGSSDGHLISWLQDYSILPLKEAMIVPCRIFWNPLAFAILKRPRSECVRAARESIAALEAQLALVRLELSKLGEEEECPGEKPPI